MAAQIGENVQYIDESSGELLVNGYIYIGTAGLDAKLNPITIYSDRELTTVLANPQRTGADGRSVNKIWVDGKYSIKVDSSANTQKLYDKNAGETAPVGNSVLGNVQGTNAILATASPTATALLDKQMYVFTAIASNTGPVTLKIDSLTAYPITKGYFATLSGGEISAGVTIVVWNSALSEFQLLTKDGAVYVKDKAAAKLIEPTSGASLIILSDDGAGRVFRALTGALPGTYSDDVVGKCGSIFIPSGGDGSSAWQDASVANALYLVPTDFSTLQDAVSVLSNSYHKQVEIRIESGHLPSSGITVTNGNYSFITITSVDAEVDLDVAFNVSEDFIAAVNATSPVLDCLINAQGRCRYGVNIQRSSHIDVNPGCGVKNVAQRGIYLNNSSSANATDTIWTGAGSVATTGNNRGAWIARGSTLIAEGADFSNSEGVGVYVSRASTVHAMDLVAENCGEQALWCHRSSRVTAHSVVAPGVRLSTRSGSVHHVVQADRTSLVSINADAGSAPVTVTQNGAGDGVSCAGGSTVNMEDADIVGSGGSDAGVAINGGGTVNASGASITSFGGINVDVNGGIFNAPLSTITNAGTFGLQVKRGRANVASASITGSASLDINNSEGSFTNADSCSTTNGVGSPDLADVNTPSFNAVTGRGAIFT